MLGPEDRGGFGALSFVGDVAAPIRPLGHGGIAHIPGAGKGLNYSRNSTETFNEPGFGPPKNPV